MYCKPCAGITPPNQMKKILAISSFFSTMRIPILQDGIVMKPLPLFCFGSLMDWDVLTVVLGCFPTELSMVPAQLPGHRVAKLPHESYPMLVADEDRQAPGQLLIGLTESQLDRVIFFEGEEYQLSPCVVTLDNGSQQNALFFSEGIMPTPEMGDWDFHQWRNAHKDHLLRQSAAYMAYYGKMSAQEADYYWQTYSEEPYLPPLAAVG